MLKPAPAITRASREKATMLSNEVEVVEEDLGKLCVKFDQLHTVLIVRTESTMRFEMRMIVGSRDEKK